MRHQEEVREGAAVGNRPWVPFLCWALDHTAQRDLPWRCSSPHGKSNHILENKTNECAVQLDASMIYHEDQISCHSPVKLLTNPTSLPMGGRMNPCLHGELNSWPPPSVYNRTIRIFLFLLSLCCTMPHQKYICSEAYFLKMDNLVKSLPLWFHLQFQMSSSTTCSSKSPFYSHEKEFNDPLI